MSIQKDEKHQDEGKNPTISNKLLPRIIIGNNKLKYLKCNKEELLKNLNFPSTYVKPKVDLGIKEDVIYESRPGDFLKLDSGKKVFVVNRLNLATNSSRTVAFMSRGEQIGSSDAIVDLIGQKNYDVLFSALCSVISLELKVRGILALLLDKYKLEDKLVSKSNNAVVCEKKTEDKVVQTTETSMEIIIKQKQRKRAKRPHLMPYVVKDSPQAVKRVVISPEYFNSFSETPIKFTETTELDRGSTLPTITFIDEDSNTSIGNMSSLSINTLPHLLEDPNILLNNIEKFTETHKTNSNGGGQIDSVHSPTMLTLLDGTRVEIPIKPEDDFHVATADILRYVAPEYRRKLLLYQGYLDWTYCMQRDEEGYMPLHLAVQAADVDMVRRHCHVLKMRNESVDAVAGNMTALQMSLYQNAPQATALLLEFGADPLVTDSESRTCFHLAAEEPTDHLRCIVNYCRANPMRILLETEEFWKPELETQTKEEQARYLLDKLSQLTDSQGYTPLMLATKIGNYDNVKALVEMSPNTINQQMPNSGDTALYLAVAAACMDASNRGNMSKVTENFMKTIQILIEKGADPNIENYSGSSVNILLSEFKIRDLSLLIADALSAINCDMINPDSLESFRNSTNNYMLIKDDKGNVDIKEMHIRKYNTNTKPIIIENIRVDTKIVKLENNGTKLNDKPKDVEDSKQFINTFEKFLKKDASPVPQQNVICDNKKVIIIKKTPTKPSTSKIVSDATNDCNTKTVKTAADSKIKLVRSKVASTVTDAVNKNIKNASKTTVNSDKVIKTNDCIKIVRTASDVSLSADVEDMSDDSNRNKVRDKLKRLLKGDPVVTKAKIQKL